MTIKFAAEAALRTSVTKEPCLLVLRYCYSQHISRSYNKTLFLFVVGMCVYVQK